MNFKSFFKSILLLILFFSFHSCIVVNFAKKTDESQCKVHLKMKRTIVRTYFGLAAYDPDPRCPNAKAKANVGCVVQMWPVGRLAKIYHCTACDSISKYHDKLDKDGKKL